MLSETYVQNRVELLSKKQFIPRLGEYITESWQMIKSYPAPFAVPAFVYLSICFSIIYFQKNIFKTALYDLTTPKLIFMFFSYFGYVFTTVAFYNAADLIKSRQIPTFSAIFDFNGKFFTIFIAFFVSFILVVIGLAFFVIPGIYLWICFKFVVPFCLFTQLKGLDALDASRKIVSRSWLNCLIFFIATTITTGLGLTVLGIGVIVTYPMGFICYYLFFCDMMDLYSEDPLETLGKGVEYRDESAESL